MSGVCGKLLRRSFHEANKLNLNQKTCRFKFPYSFRGVSYSKIPKKVLIKFVATASLCNLPDVLNFHSYLSNKILI